MTTRTFDEMERVAHALVPPGRGILAADESTGTITRRLASVGVESTEENRRAWRELLFSTPDGYGRALQAPALKAWAGRPEAVPAAQEAFRHRAVMNRAARQGRYAPAVEQVQQP